MVRTFAVFLFVTAIAISGLRAQYYDWNNTSGDGLFSTEANWGGGSAPTSPVGGINFLASGTAENDLGALIVESLNFQTDGTVVTGNALNNVWQVNYGYSVTGTSTIEVDLTTSTYGFSVTAYSANQHFHFTRAVNLGEVYMGMGYAFFSGVSAYENSARFSGANGVFTTTVPSVADVYRTTLSFDNSEGVNESRWSADALVRMRDRGRLQLIGNASANVTQNVANVLANFSEVLEVQNRGALATATLEIGQLTMTDGAVVLHRSTGDLNQVLGSVSGPRIKYEGQGLSDFLGPQMFYLSGDLEGGTGLVQYAAYDTVVGVTAATTSEDNVETVDDATANVLQTTTSGFFSGTSTMHSLAYNAGDLAGDGTFNLTHLLLGPSSGTLGVGLNFGDREGSITAENWNSIVAEKQTFLSANIQGTNSVTFRGSDEIHLTGYSAFSGTVRFAGTDVVMDFSGQLAEVSGIELGTEGKPSRITLRAGMDRLADDAGLLVTGESSVDVYADLSMGHAGERVGDITLRMEMDNPFDTRRFTLWVRPDFMVDPSTSMAFTAKSLTFAEEASGNRVDLIVQGEGNSITVEGAAIAVKNGNTLNVEFKTTDTRIDLEGGVTIALGEDGTVGLNASNGTGDPFAATLGADLNLQDGTLNPLSDHGLLTLEGDLTMGEGLDTYLYLNEANIGAALIAIEGDVRLDGTLYVSSNLGYGEGEWLLFTVTGSIVDAVWDVVGQDGDYYYYVDGQNVYLTTSPIPEPGAVMLLAAGVLALGARRFRRRD